MKTIYDIDIESMAPIGGFKSSDLMVAYAARRSGKSMLNQWYRSLTMPSFSVKFNITDQALVDGETWYTVECVYEVSEWLREQPKEWWAAYPTHGWVPFNGRYDIHEKLYTMLVLRWS